MKTEMNSHAPEECLERYSMHRLTEEESESLEDHLMFCDWCQEKLESVESFHLVVRVASRRVRQEDLKSPARSTFWSRFPRFSVSNLFGADRPRNWFALPATAAAMACLALFIMVPQSQEVSYQQVRLESFRGSAVSSVDSTKPLELALNLDGLPQSPAYRVEIVNAAGVTYATALAEPQGRALTVRIKNKLSPGQYWVRLYIPGANELLQEFSMRSS